MDQLSREIVSQRPEVLFALFRQLTALDGIGPKAASMFKAIEIDLLRDLIYFLPYAGKNRTPISNVSKSRPPENIIVETEVLAHFAPKKPSGVYRVEVTDYNQNFHLVFFGSNKDMIKSLLPVGGKRVIAGKIELYGGNLQIVHPDHILPKAKIGAIPKFEPIYHLTVGLTQKKIQKAIHLTLKFLPDLPEWIDENDKISSKWPSWSDAIKKVHCPVNEKELLPTNKSRERLAYDEFFAHQLTLSLARLHFRNTKGRETVGTGFISNKILNLLPYNLTENQKIVIAEIKEDMAKPIRMNRLLQGDVGAGKTIVAFLSLITTVESGGQGVLMAPTEILVRQHFEVLKALAFEVGVEVEILTGSDKGTIRSRKLQRIADGKVGILIGTHAVFQKDVHFKNLRLAVIDEQHRFGVAQRLELARKGEAVDILLTSATPIPRSLALAQYGDMEISFLKEKPPGRKYVNTVMVSKQRIGEVIRHLIGAINIGKQAYWVCPLVEDSEVFSSISVEKRYGALREALGQNVVDLVHGQMSASEKDEAMAKFESGHTKVLIATTVIEVGINLPNATIMIIENAEVFGLSQLHQLRGRVGRGKDESTCLLFYEPPLSENARSRLELLRDTEDGFAIAKKDLEMRGIGDLIGTAQTGFPKFRVGDLVSMSELMFRAHLDARKLLDIDPSLKSKRGKASRILLSLMGQEMSFRMLSIG